MFLHVREDNIHDETIDVNGHWLNVSFLGRDNEVHRVRLALFQRIQREAVQWKNGVAGLRFEILKRFTGPYWPRLTKLTQPRLITPDWTQMVDEEDALDKNEGEWFDWNEKERMAEEKEKEKEEAMANSKANKKKLKKTTKKKKNSSSYFSGAKVKNALKVGIIAFVIVVAVLALGEFLNKKKKKE